MAGKECVSANLATLLLDWTLIPSLESLPSLAPRELHKRWRTARLALRSLPPHALSEIDRRKLVKLASVARLGGNPDPLFVSTPPSDLLDQLMRTKPFNQCHSGLITDLIVDNRILEVQKLNAALECLVNAGAPMQTLRLVEYLTSERETSVPWAEKEEEEEDIGINDLCLWPTLWNGNHGVEPKRLLSMIVRRLRDRFKGEHSAAVGQILTCLLAWPRHDIAHAIVSFVEDDASPVGILLAQFGRLLDTAISSQKHVVDNKVGLVIFLSIYFKQFGMLFATHVPIYVFTCF